MIEIIKEGWLWKRSQHLKQWRRRWVKLTPTSLLCLASTGSDGKLRCTTVLVFPPHSPQVEYDNANTEFFVFVAIHGIQRLYFGAESSSDREQWKKAILAAPQRQSHGPRSSRTLTASDIAFLSMGSEQISPTDEVAVILFALPDLFRQLKQTKKMPNPNTDIWANWRGTQVEQLCSKARSLRKEATYVFVRSDKEQMYLDSVSVYSQALELDPMCGPAWYGKGVALRRLCLHEDAVRAFVESLKIDCFRAPCWNCLGLSLVMLDRWDDAIPCLYASVRVDATNVRFASDHALAIEWKHDVVEFERQRELVESNLPPE
jgi:tetratricopeptide (TPR) repeat protein